MINPVTPTTMPIDETFMVLTTSSLCSVCGLGRPYVLGAVLASPAAIGIFSEVGVGYGRHPAAR